MIDPNELVSRAPTKNVLSKGVLAIEIIGDLSIELSRLPNGDTIIEVRHSDEILSLVRHRGLTEFQAGRVFEREVSSYQRIVS